MNRSRICESYVFAVGGEVTKAFWSLNAWVNLAAAALVPGRDFLFCIKKEKSNKYINKYIYLRKGSYRGNFEFL